MELNGIQDLVAFDVNGLLCGIDMRHVQEINKNLQITQVHQSPQSVRGVLNLRGNIVSVMNMHDLLGQNKDVIHSKMRIIVVQYQNESVGLLVDEVHDILRIQAGELSPPPAHLHTPPSHLVQAVCKRPNELILILDLNALLKVD